MVRQLKAEGPHDPAPTSTSGSGGAPGSANTNMNKSKDSLLNSNSAVDATKNENGEGNIATQVYAIGLQVRNLRANTESISLIDPRCSSERE